MAIEIGQKAPDFSLPSSKGNEFKLSDNLGKWIVLYFYPKDDTPGCTTEACAFRDKIRTFTESDIEIVGISTDTLASHEKFISKYGLPFELLSDSEKEVVKLYGILREKSMFGKTFLGVVRSTFLINPEGEVAKIWRNVKVNGHIDEVLKTAQEMSS